MIDSKNRGKPLRESYSEGKESPILDRRNTEKTKTKGERN